MQRLEKDSRCAVGIVEFDLARGVMKHVSIRGRAELYPIEQERRLRFLAKYLGEDRKAWNEWFMQEIADPLDRMGKIILNSLIAKNLSFFKTGPEKIK